MNDRSNASPQGLTLLSNGRYFVTITAAGTGQSRRHGHVVNRWTGDPVEDSYGQFLYFRDLDSGEVWSIGRQPAASPSTKYAASSSPGQFHIEHDCYEIAAQLNVAVSPTDDLEVRRLRLNNSGTTRRRIEVTSYFEAVLNSQGADVGHPAFSKLFLQTDYIASESMLVVNRRPRANGEHWPTLFHAMTGEKPTEWETDRLRFLGRGRTAGAAVGLRAPLSGTIGNVLDPCCALRVVVDLAAGEERALSFLTGIAETNAEAVASVRRSRTVEAIEGIFNQAASSERTLRKELGISPEQASRFEALGAAMHVGDRRLKLKDAPPVGIDANAVLGRFGIPRDRMLLIALGGWKAPATQEIKLAREYFGRKGFFTNLLVLEDDPQAQPADLDDRVFTKSPDGLNAGELALLAAAASVVIADRLPQVACDWSPAMVAERFVVESSSIECDDSPLEFFNGFGGFSRDGREYVIRLPWTGSDRKWPPLPWINVVANQNAGFLISESGASCSWARNSQTNRITPWSNEPVRDPHGEALYLRDEDTGEFFSPLPGPVGTPVSYEVRHGFGHSTFAAMYDGLEMQTTLFVPQYDPVKIVLLKMTNQGRTARRLSLTAYQELVLGGTPSRPSLIVTSRASDDSLRAVNLAAGDFQGGIAFCSLSVDGTTTTGRSLTCDRASFLGRFGMPESPAALQPGQSLDGATGHGFDPCFAQQQSFAIESGAEVECVLLLGEGMSEEEATELVDKYRRASAARAALDNIRSAWRNGLGRLQVETPSKKLNLMVNGWLPYQTLGCRLWARSGFYQSSGAFGFRDQLQDAGNLLALEPRLARDQILLHARHQFVDGDVLHWWHPEPIDRGLRTRFSDDLLWLPLITADYVRGTGDVEILDEHLPFIKGPALHEGEDEVYITPEKTDIKASLYEHCCRTIDRSLTTGAHGLPLMGCGDWNDGMNRVGRDGRGESVWLGFFLFKILGDFLPYCRGRNDDARVTRYSAHREKLQVALNEGGWDGEWYRRAYYDNGDPLGSKQNDECRIDAIAQAWAVISGAAPPDRAHSCMAAMSRELISESDGIIRLLTPPFVNTPNDPGYIKGYVAGIRENGGQYTHAACWAVMALALQGENDLALRLWEMLAPISHGESEHAANHYKGEPYVLPGDVYGAPPHVGRCGWSWYTGSSGWLYRVALESILGIRIEDGRTLVICPCVPDEWPAYEVILNRTAPSGSAADRCVIRVENPNARARSIVQALSDGMEIPVTDRAVRIPLRDDGGQQQVRIVLG
jgi:cellobiose phosphorylase